MKKIEILTKYAMFVDDNFFVEIEEYMEMTMTASTEVLYLVFSFPNLEIRESPLSLDKYFINLLIFKYPIKKST